MRWLRNEVVAGRVAKGISPAVTFHADIGDWFVVGFEHFDGRPADLAPGSPDLPAVADVVNRIGEVEAGGLRSLADRWSDTDWWSRLSGTRPEVVDGWDVDAATRLSARIPGLVAGDSLVHTDLHGNQVLLGDDGAVRVVDWGLPASGARWVDPTMIVLRLIEAGHDAADAERWARSALPSFAEADDETVTAFACYLAGLWTFWAVDSPGPGVVHRAVLARHYLRYRLLGNASANGAMPIRRGFGTEDEG
ncbi:hypothetical protein [Saccharothrix violaceirubra]|uniref:Phosphotransferase family enzyme n=1 Tax=Saccharothrix violaceirubra TaxID=413306 RepID=A0A7W7WTC7_9PSEU|nr:hypothetical protein [Saccharothrix violaceirubra]MBB4963076.1 hypothetical protein [Saccharothrix violaceirubra]